MRSQALLPRGVSTVERRYGPGAVWAFGGMNGDFEAGEPALGADSTPWSDRFAGADEDKVARLRLLDKVVAQALLELVIG